ncbi:TPA: ANR family transcriptional regulator [Serratia liquefaciens]
MRKRDDKRMRVPEVWLSPQAQEQLAAQYAQLTHQAAALERAGLFGDAAALWHAGRECALAAPARFWCETREAVCLHHQRRACVQSQCPQRRRS